MDSRLLSGTVEMLILDVLARGDSYGYQIAQTVLSQSDGYFQLKEGSLYPALHRLERQKLLGGYWVAPGAPGAPETSLDGEALSGGGGGRRRKYYRLTPKGRAALKAKRDEWQRFAAGVSGVLGQRSVVA
ncbi:MAG: helix-turn-helix transcriptional regulator [Planctomycetota bacterium]|nr:helix-turn-helix transcriptional regulator [Planctomycetota bacterium]